MTSQENYPLGESADVTFDRDPQPANPGSNHDVDYFRILVESVQDYAIFLLDPAGNVVTWNLGAERSQGYTAAEILGRHYRCFFTRDDIDTGQPELQLEIASKDGRFEAEGWRLRKDGTLFWAGIVLTGICTPDGTLRSFIEIVQDLTESKAREEALRISGSLLQQEQERLRITLQTVTDAVISTDSGGNILTMNPAAEKTLGRSFVDVAGQPIESVMTLIDSALDEPVENPVYLALRRRAVYESPVPLLLTDAQGARREIKDSAAPLFSSEGQISGAVITFQDITGQRAVQREIEFQANHDALTGLANRRAFETRLTELLRRNQRATDLNHTLAFVDLDYFKQVNDTAGHAAGDAFLKQVGSILLKTVRQSDLAARIGGDEFALILYGCDPEYAKNLLANLLKTLGDSTFTWNDRSFPIHASIGLTTINRTSKSPAELMAQADAACYQAKREGRNRVCAFSDPPTP